MQIKVKHVQQAIVKSGDNDFEMKLLEEADSEQFEEYMKLTPFEFSTVLQDLNDQFTARGEVDGRTITLLSKDVIHQQVTVRELTMGDIKDYTSVTTETLISRFTGTTEQQILEWTVGDMLNVIEVALPKELLSPLWAALVDKLEQSLA